MAARVLIVDDALFMRTMLRNIFAETGYDVVGETGNGTEAVEKYRQLAPMADEKYTVLDVVVGKGVHIGKDVDLNFNLQLGKNVFVDAKVLFGKNVSVSQNVHLSCYPGQTLKIGNDVQIHWGDIIKGNIIIDDGSCIESSVNMTGSDEFPLRIGKNVLIKGTSYIFGSKIADNLFIEHSILVKKRVRAVKDKEGRIQPVRYFVPKSEGEESLTNL